MGAVAAIMNRAPMVLMTGFGYDPGHSIVKARQNGLHPKAVLSKPFRLDQLIDAVKTILEVNAGLLRWLGYTDKTALQGAHLSELCETEDRASLYDLTRPEQPQLVTHVTGAGVDVAHTFTPTPDGRYAVVVAAPDAAAGRVDEPGELRQSAVGGLGQVHVRPPGLHGLRQREQVLHGLGELPQLRVDRPQERLRLGPQLVLLLQRAHASGEPLEVVRLLRAERLVVEVLRAPAVGDGFRKAVLDERLARRLAEGFVVELRAGHAQDDVATLGVVLQEQVVERRHQLALHQVARGAEDDEEVGVEQHVGRNG